MKRAGGRRRLTRCFDAASPSTHDVGRDAASSMPYVRSAVGLAATGLFLAAFCGDADTECGADEYGRALVIIAVPAAAAGALIGSLIHTTAGD